MFIVAVSTAKEARRKLQRCQMWDLEIEAEVSLLNKWQRYSFHISYLSIFVLLLPAMKRNRKNLLEELIVFCYCVCCLVLLINSTIVFGIVACTFGCSDLVTTGYQPKLQLLWLRLYHSYTQSLSFSLICVPSKK